MVVVQYDPENKTLFELLLPRQELADENQLQFYLELFQRENIRLTAKIPMVWSIHFCYELDGMPLRMVYDEDYGLVRFSVENAAHRQPLAQALKRLIEARGAAQDYCVKED